MKARPLFFVASLILGLFLGLCAEGASASSSGETVPPSVAAPQPVPTPTPAPALPGEPGAIRPPPAPFPPGARPPFPPGVPPPFASAGPAGGAEASSAVVSLDEQGLLRIGLVTVDAKQRTVTFPASVNMQKGLLEYALVAQRGKRHESLLLTDAEPFDVHVALLLLGLKGNPVLAFQGDPRKPEGDPVQVWLEWTDASGAKKKGRIEDWVWQVQRQPGQPPDGKKTSMPHTDWVFTGSRIWNGVLMAQVDRSIIALYHDPAAMIDNPLPEGASDETWFANADATPPAGTPVAVTIQAVK